MRIAASAAASAVDTERRGETAISNGRPASALPNCQAGDDIGRELFRLVAKARELGLDPETELRAAASRYRDLVHAWERSRPPRSAHPS